MTFKEVLSGEVGKAAVAEFMAPGFGGNAMMGAKKNGSGPKTDQTAEATEPPEEPEPKQEKQTQAK